MNETPILKFNDGHAIPQVGQGVALIAAEDAARNVRDGIAAGYRAVDTAVMYGNEEGVGAAVRESGKPIFVTSKLWHSHHGRDAARRGFDESYARLGLDWIDLYLIHWPVPQLGLFVDTWKTLIDLRQEGRVRSIGVSNFRIEDLERIMDATGVAPVTNQIELHPAFPQKELVEFHRQYGIVTTSWSPLGQGALLQHPIIAEIAQKHGRSPAQVVLRWHVEQGFVVIPKASSLARLKENLDLFGFALDEEDRDRMAMIARPDGRLGPEAGNWAMEDMDRSAATMQDRARRL